MADTACPTPEAVAAIERVAELAADTFVAALADGLDPADAAAVTVAAVRRDLAPWPNLQAVAVTLTAAALAPARSTR